MKPRIKIGVIVTMLIIVIMQVVPVFGINKNLSSYTLMQDNENFSLYYNEETAEVALENRNTSEIWYTNPLGIDENQVIINFNKMRLHSQLLIEVVNEKDIVEAANSFLESVKKGSFTHEVKDNKLIVHYTFGKYEVQIPLVYELTTTGLKVYVESSEIKEEGTFRLTKVAITPYFGAAQKGTEGYILVPDGCGAIMEFDQYKSNYVYGSKVYGKDLSLNNDKAPNKQERISLPVFGMKIEDKGILGIITEGEEYANIVAQQALPIVGYNYAYADFEVRVLDYYYLDEKDPGRTRKVPYISEELRANDIYCVEYNILDDENNTYVGMARFYQDYLVRNNLLQEAKNQESKLLNLDIYGGVNIDGVVLGIPVTKFIPLTTFKQSQYMVEGLLDKGAKKLNVRYRGWEQDGLVRNGTDNKVEVASKLGGKRQKKKIVDELNKKDVPIYFEHDLVTYKPKKLSFLDLGKAIKNVGNYYAYQYSYSLPTKEIDKSIERTLLMKPTALAKRMPKILNTLEDYVAIQGMGNLVYHDSHGVNGSISATIDNFQKQLGKIEEGRSILLENPNMYALKYTDVALDIPVYSSGYINFTRDVPFYQMVLEGHLDYFTPSINRTANPREMILKAIESGSGVSIAGVYEDPNILLDTQYNGLRISQYDRWKDTAIEAYEAIDEVKKLTKNSKIMTHDELQENLVIIEYENNVKIIINYNKEEVEYDSKIIQGKDYIILNS